jgi:hypothetical protein
MGEPLRIEELRDAFRNMTDEEHDEIMAELVREGIMDEDGNVLKRFPEPPDWLLEASRNGEAPKEEPPVKPAKKSKRSRKRS